jgi:hypothetical protein
MFTFYYRLNSTGAVKKIHLVLPVSQMNLLVFQEFQYQKVLQKVQRSSRKGLKSVPQTFYYRLNSTGVLKTIL